MRRVLLLAAVALAACQPPAPQEKAEAPPAPPEVEASCNIVVPDVARAVRLGDEPVAVATLPPELPGGPITPGTYDLTAGYVVDGAPAWNEDRFVALEVAESNEGVVFNWAEARSGAPTERWSASFHQGPPARLQFGCGREGETEIQFAAQPATLQLRLPDAGGTGAMVLLFSRRN